MARPTRNGVAERKIQTPRDVKPVKSERKPIGKVPDDLGDDEKDMWKTIVSECPWVDSTHRRWVRGLAFAAARVECIAAYFRRRKAEYAERGHDVALAYLSDEGKRHPLMTELLAAEEGMRKSLTALGASPASQVKMMSDVGEAKGNAKLDAVRKSYFK